MSDQHRIKRTKDTRECCVLHPLANAIRKNSSFIMQQRCNASATVQVNPPIKYGFEGKSDASSKQLPSNYAQKSHAILNINNDEKVASTTKNSSPPRNMQQFLAEFIENAPSIGIELLWDDQRWLYNILYGTYLSHAASLLHEYVEHWYVGIENEQSAHKQQNAGRYQANCFLRAKLTASKIKLR